MQMSFNGCVICIAFAALTAFYATLIAVAARRRGGFARQKLAHTAGARSGMGRNRQCEKM